MATAGFNVIAATQSSATTGTLSGWMAMDGNIRWNSTTGGTVGWANENTGSPSCPSSIAGAIDVPGTHGLFNCGAPNPANTATNTYRPLPAKLVSTDSSILPNDNLFFTRATGTEGTMNPTCTSEWQKYTDGQKFGAQASYTYAPKTNDQSNAKTAFGNVYLVARKNASGDVELYMGAERLSNNGDAELDFQFFQAGASVTPNASNACTGSLNTPYEQGDFTVEFDFLGGGSNAVPTVLVWDCTGAANSGTNTNPSIGTPCAPGQNPSFTSPGFVADTGLTHDEAQFNDNSGSIPCGGWICPEVSGTPPALSANEFSEAAVDLAGPDINLQSTCASTVVPESRSSGTTTSSDLKEFAGPATFSTCPSTTVTSPVLPTSHTLGNSWSDTATVQGMPPASPAPTGSVSFYVCSPAVLAANSATTCSSSIGTLIPGTTGLPNPAPLTAGTTSSTATSPPVTPDSAGTWCFAGYYGGEAGHYSGSNDTSTDECFVVNPAPTTTTTVTTGDVTLGPSGSATDTATVSSTGGVPLQSGDTVQFYECKVSSSVGQIGPCANTTANKDGAAVPISGTPQPPGSSTPLQVQSPSVTPTSVGSYCFSAVFSGDANYGMSTDNTTGPGVSAECFSVNPASTTTTTVTSGNVTLSPTGSATDTATVSSTAGVPLQSGDTVQFYECKVSSSQGQVGPCAATVANEDGSAVPISGTPQPPSSSSPLQVTSPSVTPTSVGSYCFSAVFSGDANYGTSSDNTSGPGVAAECFNVAPASTTTTTVTSGNVTLSPTGSATDTATVSSTGGVPLASGDTVQFYDCKVSSSVGQVGSCAATAANEDGSAVSISGTPQPPGSSSPLQVTSPSITPTSVGSYCFSAVFSGDANYVTSSDNTTGPGVTAECFSVAPASTTTTTVTSGNVDLNPSGTATDTATVSSTGGVPLASGDTVQFYECKVSSSTGVVGTCAATAANEDGAAVPISGTPQPPGSSSPLQVTSPPVTPTSVGSYCFSAVFSGDANYLSSSDNTTGDGVSSECFSVTQPNFTVAKSDLPGTGLPVNPGATIPYTVVITNVGNGLGTATITDNAPSNVTVTGTPTCDVTSGTGTCVVNGSGNDWTFTVSLPPLGVATATMSAVVSPTDTTDVINTAAITSGNCTSDCSSTVTNPVPNISVTKSVSPASGTAVFPGATLTYTLTVTNSGSGTGTETVKDAAPTNTTLVSGSPACGTAPSGASCSVTSTTGTLEWSVTLPADTSMTVTFKVTVNATDTATITNFGTFTGPGCTTSPSCSTNTVNNPVIVLSAVKGSTPAPGSTVALGQTVTYSLTLTNAGTALASDVTMTDAVPTGTTYVAGSATCGGESACTASETGGIVTWTGLNIAAGTTNALTLTFQVTVNSTDTNNEVISNFALFTNEGTPNCTTATCPTNTVTLTVIVPATAPAASPPPIVAATIVHTGEPWAGSRPIEIGAFIVGLGLVALGDLKRRRTRHAFSKRHVD